MLLFSADAESWAQDTGKDESAQKLVPKGELILSDKVQHVNQSVHTVS